MSPSSFNSLFGKAVSLRILEGKNIISLCGILSKSSLDSINMVALKPLADDDPSKDLEIFNPVIVTEHIPKNSIIRISEHHEIDEQTINYVKSTRSQTSTEEEYAQKDQRSKTAHG